MQIYPMRFRRITAGTLQLTTNGVKKSLRLSRESGVIAPLRGILNPKLERDEGREKGTRDEPFDQGLISNPQSEIRNFTTSEAEVPKSKITFAPALRNAVQAGFCVLATLPACLPVQTGRQA